MKNTLYAVLLALLCSGPAICQLAQLHPELCGTPNGVIALPQGISVTGGPEIELFIRLGAPALKIQGPYEIDEVCPLSDGRLVVFGNMSNGSSFSIVDPTKPSLVDTVWAYGPVLSPDEKWIVFRKFYPRTTDLPASDEYLRYDLSKSPMQNRSPGDTIDDQFDVGTAIYPLGWNNELVDNIGAPESQQHWHQSNFFWAADSRAVLFADRLMEERNIVLVTIDEKGATAASVFPIPGGMECADPSAAAKGKEAQPTRLRRIEFGPQEGPDRMISIDFEADGCAPKTLQLHSDSFQPAKTEPRVVERPTRKAVIDK